MTKKKVAKSVRLTEEVYDYIDSAAGKGFNEKFENIILEAKRGESDRKKELARLEHNIERLQHKESLLYEKYDFLDESLKNLIHAQHILKQLKDNVDKAADLEEQIKKIDKEIE